MVDLVGLYLGNLWLGGAVGLRGAEEENQPDYLQHNIHILKNILKHIVKQSWVGQSKISKKFHFGDLWQNR